jgi:hypothetical protein
MRAIASAFGGLKNKQEHGAGELPTLTSRRFADDFTTQYRVPQELTRTRCQMASQTDEQKSSNHKIERWPIQRLIPFAKKELLRLGLRTLTVRASRNIYAIRDYVSADSLIGTEQKRRYFTCKLKPGPSNV